MNQHVQAQLLLQLDDRGNLVTQEAVQLLGGNLARTSLRTAAANLSGLREGTDGGGRQLRQVQVSLSRMANVNGRTVKVLGSHSCGAGTNLVVVLARVGGEASQRLVSSLQLGLNSGLTLGQATSQQCNLGDLLVSECQAVHGNLGGVFQLQVVRHVLQGGRGGHRHGTLGCAGQRLQGLQRGTNVGTPHVAAVHNTGNQVHAGGRNRLKLSLRVHAVHQVKVQSLNTGTQQCRQVLTQGTVRAGHQNLRALLASSQGTVGALGQLGNLRVVGTVHGQARLVQLNPLNTALSQLLQHLSVSGNELIQTVDGCEVLGGTLLGLSAQQQGQRANNLRTNLHASLLCDLELLVNSLKVQLNLGTGTNLGHQVVVVGVEPLGHLQRRQGLGTARQGEVAGQIQQAACILSLGQTLGNQGEQANNVEHLVVVGEGRRNRVVVSLQARGGHALKVGALHVSGGVLQLLQGDLALPESLLSLLQLTEAAHAGVTNNSCGGESNVRHSAYSFTGDRNGRISGPCRPRRWGRDPRDAPGVLWGKLGWRIRAGRSGSRLGEFQLAQGLGETVAVSGQVQLIQNVQHRGMLVEGEEVQARCARIHHGAALVQCVVHADAVQLCAAGCRLQGVRKIRRNRHARHLAEVLQALQGGHRHDARNNRNIHACQVRRIDQGAVAFILKEHLSDREIRAGTLLRQQNLNILQQGCGLGVLLRVRRHTNGHLASSQVSEIFTLHAANELYQVAGERKFRNLTFLNITAKSQETAHTQTQNQADRTLQLVHRMTCANQVSQRGEGRFMHQVIE